MYNGVRVTPGTIYQSNLSDDQPPKNTESDRIDGGYHPKAH